MLKLNLARNCLKYIVRVYGIKEIFVPYYSCDTVWKALRSEKCKIHFYHIDKNMMPVCEFSKNVYILYINYFGLCDGICKKLAKQYPKLIIDNTQSFYSEPIGLASFNSLRKFFNVQNGGYLYSNRLLEAKFSVDDLNITPVLMHENYEKFVDNELLLNDEDIKLLSPMVEMQMTNFDFDKNKKLRREIFKNYARIFDRYNDLHFSLTEECVPYCYPFKTSNTDILNKLERFILLNLWGRRYSVIALPLNDADYANKILHSFSGAGMTKEE